MRRMKTDWELVNHGEVQENGNVLLDHTFELIEGDYFIYFDDMKNNRCGQGTFIVTKEVVATDKEWGFLCTVNMGGVMTLLLEFDNTLTDIYLSAAGSAVDAGTIYIYKKS